MLTKHILRSKISAGITNASCFLYYKKREEIAADPITLRLEEGASPQKKF